MYKIGVFSSCLSWKVIDERILCPSSDITINTVFVLSKVEEFNALSRKVDTTRSVDDRASNVVMKNFGYALYNLQSLLV